MGTLLDLLQILKKYLQIGQIYDRIMTVREVHMIYARVAQLVEYDLAKVGVAGSSPVSRSFILSEGRTSVKDVRPFFVLFLSRNIYSRLFSQALPEGPAFFP